MSLMLLAGVSIAATVVFWNRILEWVQDSLLPWFHTNLPSLAPYVEGAFVALDHLVVSAKRAAFAAWNYIRSFLLKATVYFEKRSSGWLRRTISYVRRSLEPNAPVYKKTEEQEVPYEELPGDIREQMLRSGRNSPAIDATRARDEEFIRMGMVHG